MGDEKCWLSESGMVYNDYINVKTEDPSVPCCMCSCEHLTCGKLQQLEKREPNRSMHRVWYYGAGGC